jgi:Yip1 domain
MIKALMLIFTPIQTWDQLIKDQKSPGVIVMTFLLPLLLLTSTVEGYGLTRWGEPQSEVNYVKIFSVPEAFKYEAAQFVISLGMVFIGAAIVKILGETFHGKHTFRQAFTAVAYGLSPYFTLRLLDASSISPWIPWGIGILLSIMVLYHGIPRSMVPDPAHAFGLFLTSVLLLAMVTGVVRFMTILYLHGKWGLTLPGAAAFTSLVTVT